MGALEVEDDVDLPHSAVGSPLVELKEDSLAWGDNDRVIPFLVESGGSYVEYLLHGSHDALR